MYCVNRQGLTLLDSVELRSGWYPRVDGYTQQVYVTGGSRGFSVVSWEDYQLTTSRNLKCVGECWSVGVLSPSTLCACDRDNGCVAVVTDDTVIDTLRKPAEVSKEKPLRAAVLGDSILVKYGDRSLVVYENGTSSPGTMVSWPEGLQNVSGMSSDGASRFLVCDRESQAVFILGDRGHLCDRVNIHSDSDVRDCAFGDGKLWVGCENGDIIAMSSQ